MLKTEDYATAVREISGVKISVTRYKIGDRYYCHVANLDPGATIARAEAASRDEAEQAALAKAANRLGTNRAAAPGEKGLSSTAR